MKMSLIALSATLLSFNAFANRCNELNEPTFKKIPTFSCVTKNTLNGDGANVIMTQSFSLKCGVRAITQGTDTVGAGYGAYEVKITQNGTSYASEKSKEAAVKMIETVDGIKGVDNNGMFSYSSEELTALAKAVGVKVSDVKVVQEFSTAESEYTNMTILMNKKGVVLFKGSLMMNTNDSLKFVSCK